MIDSCAMAQLFSWSTRIGLHCQLRSNHFYSVRSSGSSPGLNKSNPGKKKFSAPLGQKIKLRLKEEQQIQQKTVRLVGSLFNNDPKSPAVLAAKSPSTLYKEQEFVRHFNLVFTSYVEGNY